MKYLEMFESFNFKFKYNKNKTKCSCLMQCKSWSPWLFPLNNPPSKKVDLKFLYSNLKIMNNRKQVFWHICWQIWFSRGLFSVPDTAKWNFSNQSLTLGSYGSVLKGLPCKRGSLISVGLTYSLLKRKRLTGTLLITCSGFITD